MLEPTTEVGGTTVQYSSCIARMEEVGAPIDHRVEQGTYCCPMSSQNCDPTATVTHHETVRILGADARTKAAWWYTVHASSRSS